MATAFAFFLVLVLATAAGHKIAAQDRLAAATATLLGTGLPIGRVLGLTAAAIEVLAALALIFGTTRILGAVIAGALWFAYGSALFAARRRGATLDCGCDFDAKIKPVDGFALWRAGALMVLAFIVAATPFSQTGIETLFAALAMFSLYLGANELAALPPLRRSAAS